MGIETARAYFLYGNALLLKEEENPSDNLLSNVQEEEQAQPSSSNPPNEVNEEESAQNVAEDDEEDEDEAACAAAEEASPDDLELAWEVLDVSRSPFYSLSFFLSPHFFDAILLYEIFLGRPVYRGEIPRDGIFLLQRHFSFPGRNIYMIFTAI